MTPTSGAPTEIRVYQKGAACEISYAVSSSVVPEDGGSVTLQIFSAPADCNIHVPVRNQPEDAWAVPASDDYVVGTGALVYNIAANQWTTPRRGRLVVDRPETTITQSPGHTCEAAPIDPLTLVPGAITAGGCGPQWARPARYSRHYAFQGTAGQRFAVETTAPDIDPTLFLISPDGSLLEYGLEGPPGYGLRTTAVPGFRGTFLTLLQTGTHIIEVTTRDEFVTGDFNVQLIPGCDMKLSAIGAAAPAAGGADSFRVEAPTGCLYRALSLGPSWLTIDSVAGGVVTWRAAANATASQRVGEISVGGWHFAVSQGAVGFESTFTPSSAAVGPGVSGQQVTVAFDSGFHCGWAVATQPWIRNYPSYFCNSTLVNYSVEGNPSSQQRTGYLVSGSRSFAITQAGLPASGFVAVPPCRVVDTRPFQMPSAALGGPQMAAGERRSLPIRDSPCGLPANATAYSLNITVLPQERLGYLTIWPAGQPRPFVSTVNAPDGQVTANAAIVPAGSGGVVDVFVTDHTHLVIDVNGYFAASGNPFYTLPPCRAVDTRSGQVPAGAFGPPLMAGGSRRSFPLPDSPCGLPANAHAYSLNATVAPRGPLGYLTLWPAGQNQPFVSTVNSLDGQVTANAAVVPAGQSGAVNAFVTGDTDLILDVNGYFGSTGNGTALSFYPVTPCRVADTRSAGPIIPGVTARDFSVPQSGCGIPATARAYAMNITAVPPGPLAYLTAWPAGQPRPFVSTLNSFDGQVTANAAIVPAGTNGAISIFVSNPSHVVLDINGYFAP